MPRDDAAAAAATTNHQSSKKKAGRVGQQRTRVSEAKREGRVGVVGV